MANFERFDAHNILEEHNLMTGITVRIYKPIWDKFIEMYSDAILIKAEAIKNNKQIIDKEIINQVINKIK